MNVTDHCGIGRLFQMAALPCPCTHLKTQHLQSEATLPGAPRCPHLCVTSQKRLVALALSPAYGQAHETPIATHAVLTLPRAMNAL